MARIFLVHCWGGSPRNDWFPWAKKALEKEGFNVFVPEMPETEHPKIVPWLKKLTETIGEVRPDDILVGHSIGCLAVIRYLETLKEGDKVGRVILVAPWHYLTLGENEEEADAKPWLETPIDYKKIKGKANKFIAVFSEDDPWVPIKENKEYFKEKLNPEIVIKNNMGHFTESEGVTRLPFLLELLK